MRSARHGGLLARLRSLVTGVFSLWVRDRESGHPEAVYVQAIEERRRQYGELKQAVAGILYLRNRLEGEIRERRAELARLSADVARAVGRADDAGALALIAHKQALVEDLERSEQELEAMQGETEVAKENLVRFRDEIRALEREKVRTLATLAGAKARRRIQEAFEGLSVEHEMRALDGVREHVARLVAEGRLVREMDGSGIEPTLRDYREEARREAAHRELDEIKRRLRDRGALPKEVGVVPDLAQARATL
ncbi:MAG: PspA/IM30 family protein [Deltaproteobacteria bacterium]|nr:PspA/IM30 family protein [Deltaproteobacteria bacterium]